MRVELSKTYAIGETSFSAVELREPTFADYRQIGPAFDVQRGLVIRDPAAIFAYADRLVTSPAHGALAALNLADTLAVEDAIVGFFIEARKSRAKSMNSSSGSDGNPATSTS